MRAPTEPEVTAAVQKYVEKTRGWPTSQYRIEINRREDETVVAWVIHKDDEKTPAPGGGRSFEAYVDLGLMQVVKELAFQ